MLQRLQTLFLLLIVILASLFIFAPFELIKTYQSVYLINLKVWDKAEYIKPIIYLPFSLNILVIVLTLFTIFKFKNRALQMVLCRVIAFISGCIIACLFSFSYINLTEANDAIISYSYITFLPGLNVLLAFIAKRFIKYDEELVKSADRIR